MQSPHATTTTLFDIDHPFISHRFIRNDPTLFAASQSFNAKRSLLELGILLLEICCEETFEDYAHNAKLLLENAYGRRYDGARKWLDDVYGDVPQLLYDAANACIECSFARTLTVPDWSDDAFQKSVCEGVIKPLWENCSGLIK